MCVHFPFMLLVSWCLSCSGEGPKFSVHCISFPCFVWDLFFYYFIVLEIRVWHLFAGSSTIPYRWDPDVYATWLGRWLDCALLCNNNVFLYTIRGMFNLLKSRCSSEYFFICQFGESFRWFSFLHLISEVMIMAWRHVGNIPAISRQDQMSIMSCFA